MAEEKNNTYLVDLDKIDLDLLAEILAKKIAQEQLKNEAERKEVKVDSLPFKVINENNEYSETESINVKLEKENGKPAVLVLTTEQLKELGFKDATENEKFALVNLNKTSAKAQLYTKTKDVAGKMQTSVKELGNKAVHAIFEKIEAIGIHRYFEKIQQYKQDAKDYKKDVTERAAHDYAEWKMEKGEEFQQLKTNMFERLSKNVEQAKDKVQETVMKIASPFLRAKEALQAGLSAGKEAWQNSKDKFTFKKDKPKLNIREKTGNERSERTL